MSLFETRLDEYLSGSTDTTDLRAMVRRLWDFDFDGIRIRLWEGQGLLHTEDGNTWLGTKTPKANYLQVPRLSDGRDGTAPIYQFGFGYVDKATYQALKADQTKVYNRPLTCYLALFQGPDEGLRPNTPIEHYKSLTMLSSAFEEKLVMDGRTLVRRYRITVQAKDGNSGRSQVPRRTYADTMQKEYAKQLGVELDRGAEFLAGLANRTYKVPK